jgi:hypothetical protein
MLTLMHSLKSSIDANTHVIPGEDAGQLQAVIESYQHKYQPFHAFEWFLVDGMISADWELRRLRMVETQLWQRELAEGGTLADVYTRNPVLLRVQRQNLAIQRSYYRFRKEMVEILKAEDEAIKGTDWSEFFREERPDPEAGPGSPAAGDSQAPAPESGSFLPKDAASEAPAPELGSFLPNDVVGEAPAPELGSFLPKDVVGEAPAPELGSFLPKDVASEAPAPELGSFLRKDLAGKGACPGIGFVPTKRCRRRGAAGYQVGFVSSSQRLERGARESLTGIRRLRARTTRRSGHRERHTRQRTRRSNTITQSKAGR